MSVGDYEAVQVKGLNSKLQLVDSECSGNSMKSSSEFSDCVFTACESPYVDLNELMEQHKAEIAEKEKTNKLSESRESETTVRN